MVYKMKTLLNAILPFVVIIAFFMLFVFISFAAEELPKYVGYAGTLIVFAFVFITIYYSIKLFNTK